MFDSYGTDRLVKWKEFRETLETSPSPIDDVVKFWARAPFVNPYLNPNKPTSWPDPWHLILDNKFDDLAIALGILYTIKLTQRFMDSNFEIHTTTDDNTNRYFIVLDKRYVLNLEYGSVCDFDAVNVESSILYSGKELP